MKFPFLFVLASVLLATFVFMLLSCAVAVELQVWVSRKIRRER